MSYIRTNIITIFSFLLFLIIFILIFLFVNLQQDKYNYFLYIYGEEIRPGAQALIKVISRDGEIASSPEIFVNGKKSDTFLIDLRPDLKEISVKIGSKKQVFPIKYSDLEKLRIASADYLHLSLKELENVPSPSVSGTKKVFLLPDQFRAVSEFETKIHLFCVDNEKPCSEKQITINGIPKELNSGYLNFTTIFTHEKSVNISFDDGTSFTAKVPYSGKMFMLYSSESGMTVASLSDVRNVHIDCYSSNKWIGTDIISVYHTGVELPEVYNRCDHIQVSFNSASPGTAYITYSRVATLMGDVNDPYYSELGKSFKLFSPAAQASFIKSYNASFFKPLSLIFSGEVLEKQFMEKKNAALDSYWWMILMFSLVGLLMFVCTALKKVKVVEGEEGELVSLSLARQRIMIAGIVIIYVLFLTMLLYFFKNLA